jgi:Icc-related predicted phosphoesterase
MRIQYCSDLHLEFQQNKDFLKQNPLIPGGEILILAGDIMPLPLKNSFTAFFNYLSDTYEQVYWVPGNHEYYYYNLGTAQDPLCEQIRSNVFLLNNYTKGYNDVNFICTTLWGNISPINEWDIQRSLSDFEVIKWNERKFRPGDFNQLHQSSLLYLQNAFEETAGQKNIVITHHVPTLFNYPSIYNGSVLNEAFVVELYDLIHDSSALYWIYGHHHQNTPPFKIGNTTLITNQLGYVQHEQPGFSPKATISV